MAFPQFNGHYQGCVLQSHAEAMSSSVDMSLRTCHRNHTSIHTEGTTDGCLLLYRGYPTSPDRKAGHVHITAWVTTDCASSAFERIRRFKLIYFFDPLALLGEIGGNFVFFYIFIANDGSNIRTGLSWYLRKFVAVHKWSSLVDILHACFSCSLMVLLVLVTIIRLVAILKWYHSQRGAGSRPIFDFLTTTFGEGMEQANSESLSWWRVLLGDSVWKVRLPWVDHKYLSKEEMFNSYHNPTQGF